MADITLDDLFNVLDEIEKGAFDKKRSIKDIKDVKVKSIFENEIIIVKKEGLDKKIIASVGIGSAATIGASSLISGAATTVGVAGASSIVSGVVAGAAPAATGAAIGATTGSSVPIIGTIIGAAVGAGIGFFVGSRIVKRRNNEKIRLFQQALEKLNKTIAKFEEEVEELKEKYKDKVYENERLKYMLACLFLFEEMKSIKIEG